LYHRCSEGKPILEWEKNSSPNDHGKKVEDAKENYYTSRCVNSSKFDRKEENDPEKSSKTTQ
jgi:hypothetical protein